VRLLPLTNLRQGVLPQAIHSFPREDSDDQNMLLIQGAIGKVLLKQFEGLAEVEDWEGLHRVVTMTLKRRLEADGEPWIPATVEPANVHDLLLKTKLRWLALHQVRHVALEAQKRQVSFDCALIGLKAVKRVEDCKVRDSCVRIPSRMNQDLGSCLATTKTVGHSRLMKNQASTVSMKIGVLSVPSNRIYFLREEVQFYKSLSREKAEAAGQLEVRSWNSHALKLCEDPAVLEALHPPDFHQEFHDRCEETTTSGKVATINSTKEVSGKFIHPWLETAVKTIRAALFDEKKSNSFAQDMPGMHDKEVAFYLEKLTASSETNTQSKWTFPKIIPKPQGIHALVHLLFLIGPAHSLMMNEETFENRGLANLIKVINSSGTGALSIASPCAAIEEDDYEQTVS
jgi:hypothetical protein